MCAGYFCCTIVVDTSSLEVVSWFVVGVMKHAGKDHPCVPQPV